MDELLKLAARCEKATGPDRETDAAIHAALYEAVVFDPKWKEWVGAGGMNVRKFTSSLDAAMTLVPEPPEGFRRSRFELVHGSGDPAWFAKLLYVGPPRWLIDAGGIAATPALALCAAALRARANPSLDGER